MPLGERYRLTGVLLKSPRGPVLQMDDGGVWALDVNGHEALQGARVTVEGTRVGYDRLDVEWIGRG